MVADLLNNPTQMQLPLTEARVKRMLNSLHVIDPTERLYCPLCSKVITSISAVTIIK